MKSYKLTTLFYLIESPYYTEKYIGLTTRTLQQRFNEHKKSKDWIIDNTFSIREIDRIEHNNIHNLEDFLREKNRAANKEKNLISTYSREWNLQNISIGGEWGMAILWQIKQEKWITKYGSIEGFREYKQRENNVKKWLSHWVSTRKTPILKTWLNHWVSHRKTPQLKTWLNDWVAKRKTPILKTWLRDWVTNRKTPQLKTWLRDWVTTRKRPQLKTW
jgi:predicted GIY-YIG superfamily endonuclease